jgi:3-dehydroquinate synthase
MFVFPHGEQSKSIETLASLLDFLAEHKVARSDTIAALGGGVVGDLTGFAASCYMRGIKFVQIPTTLLAMVDSSVGGKTGINLPTGKNLAGAFYQPEAVICDIDTLDTLPPDCFLDGCAEVIKYGILADRELFYTPIRENQEDVIARCVEIKRDIVNEDEFEAGRRKLLNFGHTIGHAIEKLSGYTMAHGHAVAAGMAIIARASGCCDALEITNMLERYGLPTSTAYGAEELAQACLSDKKRAGDYITMVFPERIGLCVLKNIPVGELESLIQRGLEE